MSILKLAIQRILRNWTLYLFVLIGISIASGLFAGLPIYSQVISFNTLDRSIKEGHPIDRNFEVIGTNSVLTNRMWAYVNEYLGDLIVKRLEIRSISLGVDFRDPIIPVDMRNPIKPNFINVISLYNLKDNTHLLDGKWPEFTPPETREEILSAMKTPPDIETAIGVNAAREVGIQIGDILVDNSGRHFPVVGLVSPDDITNDVWWGNPSIFNIIRKPGINEDTISLSLIIHHDSMREYYPIHETEWRIIVNHELITPAEIPQIEQRIINFKSRIDTSRASLYTNLPNFLKKYREDISTTRMVVVLLGMQAFIFILYGLYLIESLILERSQVELATMVGRGSGPLQLIMMIGVEGLVIALITGTLISPTMINGIFFAWSRVVGWSYSTPFDRNSIYLSMLGAGIGWLVLLIGTVSISRRNILSWQRSHSRLDKQPLWQKYYLDVFLTAFSGLAFWQLSTSGSFIINQINDTVYADPLLLISPTLLLFAISLLMLRLYPYLLRFLSWGVGSSRGILPLNLVRLSRNPSRPSQMILLISIAAGVMLFTISYEYSLSVSQQNISHYISGADIRISQNKLSVDEVSKYPGVISVSRVFRHVSQLYSGNTITVLGIDPSSIPLVTNYPHGMTSISIQTIANVLSEEQANIPSDGESEDESDDQVVSGSSLPGVFSYDAVNSNLGIGNQQEVAIFTRPIDFNIQGLIQNFPTLDRAYVITNIDRLDEKLNFQRSEYYNDFELWLSIDPKMYQEVISIPIIQDNLISDAQEVLKSTRDNAYTQGAVGAFRLNSLILGILSTLIFSLLIYSSTSSRKFEFGILRTEGLSSSQIIRFLLFEGVIIIVLGLCIGTILGIGLLFIMRPYLNVALMRSLPQMLVYEILINWREVTLRYLILFLAYIVSLGLATWMLIRMGIHQVMRIGDE